MKVNQDQKNYDRACAEIRADRSAWRVGFNLNALQQANTWRLKGECVDYDYTGDPRHGFFAFVTSEFGIHPKRARILMRVAASFTEKECSAIGHAKLYLISQAERTKQQALLRMAREGASKSRIEATMGRVPSNTSSGLIGVHMVPGRIVRCSLRAGTGSVVIGRVRLDFQLEGDDLKISAHRPETSSLEKSERIVAGIQKHREELRTG